MLMDTRRRGRGRFAVAHDTSAARARLRKSVIHQSDFGGQESKESARFFQHLYYLRVPFVSPPNNI